MRIVIPNLAAKTYEGPFAYGDGPVPPGYITEADAIAQGLRSTPPVPDAVAPWKLRAALGKRGLVEAIDAFIASQPEPPRIQLLAAWEYVSEPIPRRSHFVAAVTKGLKLSEGTVDEIFIEAANIQDA